MMVAKRGGRNHNVKNDATRTTAKIRGIAAKSSVCRGVRQASCIASTATVWSAFLRKEEGTIQEKIATRIGSPVNVATREMISGGATRSAALVKANDGKNGPDGMVVMAVPIVANSIDVTNGGSGTVTGTAAAVTGSEVKIVMVGGMVVVMAINTRAARNVTAVVIGSVMNAGRRDSGRVSSSAGGMVKGRLASVMATNVAATMVVLAQASASIDAVPIKVVTAAGATLIATATDVVASKLESPGSKGRGFFICTACYTTHVEKVIPTLEALQEEAVTFAASLTLEEGRAILVTLSGELGAGKTAFTKAVAKALGIDDHVTSPTFVLEKIYSLSKEAAFRRLAHIDAYRLKDGSELAALGFDELMSDRDTLVMLEWPERVADMLPDATVHITLVANDDGSRTLTYAR